MIAAALLTTIFVAASTPAASSPLKVETVAGVRVVRAAEAQRFITGLLIPTLRTEITSLPAVVGPVAIGDVTCDSDIPADGLRHESCHIDLGGVPVRLKFVVLAADKDHFDMQAAVDQDILFPALIRKQLADAIVSVMPNATIVCPFTDTILVFNLDEETSCKAVGPDGKQRATFFIKADSVVGHFQMNSMPW